MKRSWFGLFLLIALLVFSLTLSWAMTKIHRPVVSGLQQAADSALSGDWETAQIQTEKAQSAWNQWSHFRLSFADHSPVEEIESSFASLSIYEKEQEASDFAAACKELEKKVEAVAEAHQLKWHTFF